MAQPLTDEDLRVRAVLLADAMFHRGPSRNVNVEECYAALRTAVTDMRKACAAKVCCGCQDDWPVTFNAQGHRWHRTPVDGERYSDYMDCRAEAIHALPPEETPNGTD